MMQPLRTARPISRGARIGLVFLLLVVMPMGVLAVWQRYDPDLRWNTPAAVALVALGLLSARVWGPS
jgi:uncharacterized membrane protein YqjE